MLGWLKSINPKIDGLTGKEENPDKTSDPSGKKVVVNKDGHDISPFDPGHSFTDTSEQIYGVTVKPGSKGTPKMDGFIQNALGHKHTTPDNVMSMFTPTSAVILNTLATEFAVFDKWFCSIPGPTDPNRGFFMSGTSNGMVTNFNGTRWSQQSYFDWLGKRGISWRAYYQIDPWAIFYFEDMQTAANKKNTYELSEFFTHVQNNNLAQYTVLQPQETTHTTLPNWQHPDAPVSEGERLYKQVYEALRNSSLWNETAFIITYDEHGGFYDHVTPPQEGVPSPDGVASPDGFKFDRLGIRIPTVVISPLIPKGTIVSGPPAAQSPTPTSQYDSTSIMATVNKIFGIKDHMHARDAWAGTFEHVFSLDTPRTDCPKVLPVVPEAPPEYLQRQQKLPLNEHLEIQVDFYCRYNYHAAEENCGKNITNQLEASLFIAVEAQKFLRNIDEKNAQLIYDGL